MRRRFSEKIQLIDWRQVDGNYVLAAAATGLIASIILAVNMGMSQMSAEEMLPGAR